MKSSIYAASLFLGLAIGTILVRSKDLYRSESIRSTASPSAEKVHRPPEQTGVSISRMISAETPAINEDMPINKALDVLFAERKSPMRTRAFLKSRIEMMTTDQLTRALMNGDVQSTAELKEVAQRLAKEDPEGTFTLLESQELRIYGMENIYTFVDALLQTWSNHDAVAVMNRLKKMKRGGSQQDFSLRFSDYWAKVDPAAAARNFSDLIYLRNMQDQGDMVFTHKQYAGSIVKSWQQTDENSLRAHVKNLPIGRERDAFETALKNLDED